MPHTDHQTMTFGEQVIPVYWCSNGCGQGHADKLRMEQHENAIIDRPCVQHIATASGSDLAFRCGRCHFKGEQPFDIAVHDCSMVAFACPGKAPQLKIEAGVGRKGKDEHGPLAPKAKL